MKLTLLIYTSALGTVLPFSAYSCPESKPSRPNQVFIMADQFRGDAMGCMGRKPVQTPNQLHNLAKSQPALCDSLKRTLSSWLEQTHDPFEKYLKP